MQVTCINDRSMPVGFPIDKWIKKGEVYNVIGVYTFKPQNVLAFVLKEIDLSGEKYEAFQASRFAPTEDISDKEFQEALDEAFDLVEEF